MKQQLHIPVMLKEAMEYLKLKPHDIVCDATLGLGGHSERILEKIAPSGRLVGIDRDEESLAIARDRLRQWSSICDFVHGNFADIDTIAQNLNIKKFDAILFDLGVSTYQLDDPERGFSFKNEGPLDMRLDRSSYISAYDLLNNLTEEEISTLLWNFGQERWHTRIAHALIQERERHPIATTVELADIVARSVPSRFRYKYYRIHPATRTFQAVRIAVNRELESLEIALLKAVALLSRGARISVIAFHSLEDRIVKFSFRQLAQEGKIKIITPKPLTPLPSEVEENPSSRSAKFRVAERL